MRSAAWESGIGNRESDDSLTCVWPHPTFVHCIVYVQIDIIIQQRDLATSVFFQGGAEVVGCIGEPLHLRGGKLGNHLSFRSQKNETDHSHTTRSAKRCCIQRTWGRCLGHPVFIGDRRWMYDVVIRLAEIQHSWCRQCGSKTVKQRTKMSVVRVF